MGEVKATTGVTPAADFDAPGERMTRGRPKRAIEENFPIVEINRLAIPERNSFKPIYQMHKWFARRASSVFRAILLGSLKLAGADIMGEYYRDHTTDPDTNEKTILDPFMGGGTTVVEALRLGCRVIGIDLNPVAWFIVKTEVEPVDVEQLTAAFERLANRKTNSGRTVRDELLGHYKTNCPGCGNESADIIYALWAKSAICTSPECKRQVPLFPSYLVAQKTLSIRFHEASCPHSECGKPFDWEIDAADLVGVPHLMLAGALDSAGEGRANKRWAFSVMGEPTICPWCEHSIVPHARYAKPKPKKVKLLVLYCPHCATVFQYRGTPGEQVACPGCSTTFNWEQGNTRERGGFLCPHCGQHDAVIESIRRLPEGDRLPERMYALQGYCAICSGGQIDQEEDENGQGTLEEGLPIERERGNQTGHGPAARFRKSKGKFFKSVLPADQRLYEETSNRWNTEKNQLPYPTQRIPNGYNTNQMIKHHYHYWYQMFNPRQLLCISTLLEAIDKEPDSTSREMLLSAFQMCLEANNMFARYRTNSGGRSPFAGMFARHEFQPKLTPCEINVWGPYPYYGVYSACAGKVLRGKKYNRSPFDRQIEDGRQVEVPSNEVVNDLGIIELAARSSTSIKADPGEVDLVITDPPYSTNVNYSELSDFFYVWLRLSLATRYPAFAPDQTPQAEECIENETRGKTADDFKHCLQRVFEECGRVLKETGLMVFTFHHEGGDTWQALLSALCDSGWEIVAVYPIQGESESSMHLLAGDNISYDLIHVCRKRDSDDTRERVAWATIRNQIRKDARNEIKRIERGVYGEDRQLSDADRRIVLIGKCLQAYSRHYGAVVDHKFDPVPLKEALADIGMMVDQLVSRESPLPRELEDIDRASYIWLTALSEKKEIKSDEVHKSTRGIIEVGELQAADLIRKGRTGRGRTYEVKTPTERYNSLLEKFKDQLIGQQQAIFQDAVLTCPPSLVQG